MSGWLPSRFVQEACSSHGTSATAAKEMPGCCVGSDRPAGTTTGLGASRGERTASVGTQVGRVGLGMIWTGAAGRCANGIQKWRKPHSQMGRLSPRSEVEAVVSRQNSTLDKCLRCRGGHTRGSRTRSIAQRDISSAASGTLATSLQPRLL
jgi:hypothetical protein